MGTGPVGNAFVEVMNAVFRTVGANLDLAGRLLEWLEETENPKPLC